MTTNTPDPAALKEALVKQCDREAAAAFYEQHLARPGEVPVATAMRMRHLDESPLIIAFARHRFTAARALAPLQARVEELEDALRKLVDKLDLIFGDSRYIPVFTVHQMHVGPYSGPNCAVEKAVARAALATPSQPIGQEQREGGE